MTRNYFKSKIFKYEIDYCLNGPAMGRISCSNGLYDPSITNMYNIYITEFYVALFN